MRPRRTGHGWNRLAMTNLHAKNGRWSKCAREIRRKPHNGNVLVGTLVGRRWLGDFYGDMNLILYAAEWISYWCGESQATTRINTCHPGNASPINHNRETAINQELHFTWRGNCRSHRRAARTRRPWTRSTTRFYGRPHRSVVIAVFTARRGGRGGEEIQVETPTRLHSCPPAGRRQRPASSASPPASPFFPEPWNKI